MRPAGRPEGARSQSFSYGDWVCGLTVEQSYSVACEPPPRQLKKSQAALPRSGSTPPEPVSRGPSPLDSLKPRVSALDQGSSLAHRAYRVQTVLWLSGVLGRAGAKQKELSLKLRRTRMRILLENFVPCSSDVFSKPVRSPGGGPPDPPSSACGVALRHEHAAGRTAGRSTQPIFFIWRLGVWVNRRAVILRCMRAAT